ncbi:MAG: class I SAM-dependent methyltransferase [Kiritimatiellae bacterium]|nr:class I SAM-dependent methyltransferase [Kiritimatiellia bacterium]
MSELVLRTKRERSVLRRHPWIFSGAVETIRGGAEPGATVRVVTAAGEPLGFAAYSPASQIRARMWTFAPEETVDAGWIAGRVASAAARRDVLFADGATNAVRLVNAEADGLPGCVIDRYGEWVVCAFNTAGAERWKREIAAAARAAVPGCRGVYERSDADARLREGLPPASGLLEGEEPPERIEIHENGCRYLVDVREGHKTGFYLDQRDNRAAVRALAAGRDVLNAFSYTGGFGIAALAGGAARVTHIDLSASALELAERNTSLNPGSGESVFLRGNVFEVLRKFRDEGRFFDLIVLDPPKFAASKGAVMKAARGYKDINLLGIKLLRPGGFLATFSCSERMEPELFRTVVAEAASDAHRSLQVLRRLQQAPDHPEGLSFPEGLYLKGLLCRAD